MKTCGARAPDRAVVIVWKEGEDSSHWIH